MSLNTELDKRILILDGAMGTMIQKYSLTEKDYHSGPFHDCSKELIGNNECLNVTRPDVIKAIHKEYIAAGADIIETNTFSANRISQSEYGCGDFASQMAYEGARLAREAADETPGRKVWVAGSMGPTSKSLSLASELSDPTFRAYSFEDMRSAYREQALNLIKGGVDILLIETCFDALNVKAALSAIQDLADETGTESIEKRHAKCEYPGKKTTFPVMVSVSVGDRSGRTLTGQTLEAFYTSVRHYPLLAFGLNCSLGAAELTPLIADIDKWCGCAVSCYPNAGLPNEMGGYDQSPEDMAKAVKDMASQGFINIAGGCCGTSPDHIRAIAEAVNGIMPRPQAQRSAKHGSLTVSGLETVLIDTERSNFTNIGERTNVAGSRKFAKLIAAGDYDSALQVASKQIEDGASVIDINMDDAMLDSTREMERFLRHISNDPAVAKAALMIDSSHWETIMAGLQNAQGKCIVNSISLKEGEEIFIEKARTIHSYGAAMVVMAFDEKGQAVTFDRKIEICSRAYRLLTEKAGICPHDIIFDVNILSIGTGIEEHSRYAVDFIEAVRWIKANLPGALTSGGVSNLSFAFRGNNAVRESMHSAFLYHAIKAGLDMAIVNPSMLQIYDDIEPELLQCVEDVIFDKDCQATERLIDKASRMLSASNGSTAAHDVSSEVQTGPLPSLSERLKNALVKGQGTELRSDLMEALAEYGSAVDIIEGPLMAGMEAVGQLFGDGRMFLPQVVKSAKVMRDAVDILNPYMKDRSRAESETTHDTIFPRIVLATVKGDVHDIGKNITGIVLTCNGFEVHDLGVMVDKETILSEAERLGASIIGVSGLITPSLFQMEELCREMSARGMTTPLFIGGATTSALHTAVKLSPLYGHVFYGADASAAAVMAKKCMMDRAGFEEEQHAEQQRIREIYEKRDAYSTASQERPDTSCPGTSDETGCHSAHGFSYDSYLSECPEDIPAMEIPASEVLPYFDWKMFYAIWGVRYGSAVPEAAELIQLRQDAEEELESGDFRIMIAARFMQAYSEENHIIFNTDGEERRFPMMRQENSKRLSLSDFVISKDSRRTSPFGMFAISVHTAGEAHVEGCCCPACSNRYEELIGRTVRQTLAEAASVWMEKETDKWIKGYQPDFGTMKIIKPAAGYASCPDHTLKGDILALLSALSHPSHHGHVHSTAAEHAAGCSCGCSGGGSPQKENPLGIRLTESFAMIPEASICGLIFMHPEATYPDIRRISQEQYDCYAARRGMSPETARQFLSHLLK